MPTLKREIDPYVEAAFLDAMDRIRRVTGTRTQVQLADVLGVKQSSISDAKRRASIPDAWLVKLFEIDHVLPARINALAAELRERGTIPCALLGRMARDTECCSRGLAATVEEFRTCRACPEGQRLAASAPLWGYSKPLPAPVVYTPPQAAPVRKAAPVAKRSKRQPLTVALAVATCRECGCTDLHACPGGCWWVEPDLCSACVPKAPKAKAPRAKRQAKPIVVAKPVITPAPVQVPEAQLADPRLVKLASALRELTADGRMRVSMLDLMRSVGAANYDEAAGLVIHAGLRTSQLSGPVQTVLVDHNARQLMASAASEVRQ